MKKQTGIIVLLLVFVVSQSLFAKGYRVGDKAEDFKLRNVDGKIVSLSDFKESKGFILIFTANQCPYAKAYDDRIIALDKKYKEKGYPVIAINSNDPEISPVDSYNKMQEKARTKNFTYPYLVDEGQKVFPQYGATKTPHVFILQKNKGDLVVKYIGAIDNNYKDADDVTEKYVEEAIEALLKNKPVKTSFTVAVGCGIKVK
ncbi:MAG: thioredoxin family protein [Paludibacter sp.]|nr:thioredoxin family protein [Paludibacter sp.]